MSRQPNRHKDIAEVVNHGGPYARLQFTHWALLVSAYQTISRVFQVGDIGASVLDFLDKEEFQKVTRLNIMLLAFRDPCVAHIYSAHLNIKKPLLFSRIFKPKEPSFFSSLFCRSDTTQKNNFVINAGRGAVYQSVMFTPDGKWFVTESIGDGVKLWNVATGQCIQTFKQYMLLYDVAVDTDGSVMIVAERWSKVIPGNSYVDLFNCRTKKNDQVLEYVNRSSRPNFLKITSNGKYILYRASDSNETKIWSSGKKQFIDEPTLALLYQHNSLSFNSDMTKIFSDRRNGSHTIFDCSELPKIKYLCDFDFQEDHRRSYIIDISPDGKYILCKSWHDNLIHVFGVFDMETMNDILKLNNKQRDHGEGNHKFFVDDGKKIVVINKINSSPDELDMHVLDVNTGKILASKNLRRVPYRYAAHKDQFLLYFPNEGIRIFSCDALIKEENVSRDGQITLQE